MCVSRKGLEMITKMSNKDNTHTLLLGIEISAPIRGEYGDYLKVKNTFGGWFNISISE